VSIVERAVARWRHFMGRDLGPDLQDAERAALEEETAYHAALAELQAKRGTFDTRPPPAISSLPPAMSLDDLRDNLEREDRLVREALDDDQD
jgi:hypothetical protein